MDPVRIITSGNTYQEALDKADAHALFTFTDPETNEVTPYQRASAAIDTTAPKEGEEFKYHGTCTYYCTLEFSGIEVDQQTGDIKRISLPADVDLSQLQYKGQQLDAVAEQLNPIEELEPVEPIDPGDPGGPKERL